MARDIAPIVEIFVEHLVAGTVDRATARCDLMSALRENGMCDLPWDSEWLDSVLRLNVSLRCSWRNYMFSQRTLFAASAEELYRAFSRKNPRDWASRWTEAGGQTYDGRMIALKDDPIWLTISDFGFPFPPFSLGSGMMVRSVDRKTAMNLGLIDRLRKISPVEVQRPRLILPEFTPEEA